MPEKILPNNHPGAAARVKRESLRLLAGALAFGVGLFGLAGCGAVDDDRLEVAVIPKGMTHDFWQSVKAGVDEAAEEHDVRIIWRGPQREGDRSAQINIVRDMIRRGVDAIVLAPTDAEALVRPVSEAAEAGIPVIVIDSGLGGDEDNYLSFVATDNFAAGRLAAERLAELLADSDNRDVILLRYEAGHASTGDREEGFLEAAGELGLNVVRENVRGGDTISTAQQASENLLNALVEGNELTIAGIFTPNEPTTAGMLQALRGLNFAGGDVRFVGFDAAPGLLDGLREGHIDALVVQNPRRIGYEGVTQAIRAIHGEEVTARIDTDVELISLDRLEEPAVRELLGL